VRVLIIHTEAQYFAGAERMLGYFLEGALAQGIELSVAVVETDKMKTILPEGISRIGLPSNQKFSTSAFCRQAARVAGWGRGMKFDCVHGWAARDWELTSVCGLLLHCPALGTLHDHPQAGFISGRRQRLMRFLGRWGLRKVVCVSEAVQQACLKAGYPCSRLRVIRNGLPALTGGPQRGVKTAAPFRFGFLGVFSKRKGFDALFEIVRQFAEAQPPPKDWELWIAGGAQEPEGEKILTQIREKYTTRAWWKQIRWVGWTERPLDFLNQIDLLICPSREFDPFPTVLLEAALMRAPALASRVGGTPEIVVDGETGWLFDAERSDLAADRLGKLAADREATRVAGQNAHRRVYEAFTIARMAKEYLSAYQEILPLRGGNEVT
jgi:glycosyltransferase involved in cell wall biosynthesis